MLYGISADTYGNGVYSRYNLDGYKTLRGLKTAFTRYNINHKRVVLGFTIFGFCGDESSKYRQDSYKTIVQFNHKAFYEYWN